MHNPLGCLRLFSCLLGHRQAEKPLTSLVSDDLPDRASILSRGQTQYTNGFRDHPTLEGTVRSSPLIDQARPQ